MSTLPPPQARSTLKTSTLQVDPAVRTTRFVCTFACTMYQTIQIEARESAQKKLNAGYPEGDSFSTRRVKLITDPAVENS